MQLDRRLEGRPLEQAAAPPGAGQLPRTVGHGDRGGVGRERQVLDRGRRGPAPRCRGRCRPRRPRWRPRAAATCDERVAPGLGRVVGHGRVGDRPRPRRAPCGGRGGQVVALRADHDRLDGRAAELVRQAAGQAERLEGRLRGHAPVVLDQHEHRPAHHARSRPLGPFARSARSSCVPLSAARACRWTFVAAATAPGAARSAMNVGGRGERWTGGHARPSSSSRSTTAGAASGPVPRMVVSVTCSTGRANASVCRPPGSPTAVCSATSAFFERSRPGRVG